MITGSGAFDTRPAQVIRGGDGVCLVDHTNSVFSSRKVAQPSAGQGPVIHPDGWSICSDVKFVRDGGV